MPFTEFYVTKGVSAADTNGGGPNLGANDGPVYACGNATVLGGAPTIVTDNTGANWTGCAVDDWMCWDTGGVKEFRRITVLAGANATVHAACTAGANKLANVGGAWAAIQHGVDTITVSFVNAASDPPRLNVQYDAAAYDEEVDFDTNTGSVTVALTYEGYESSAGDDCPNNNLPQIIPSAPVPNAGVLTIAAGIDYLVVRGFDIQTTTNNQDAIHSASDRTVFARLSLEASGNAGIGLHSQGTYCAALDAYAADSGGTGFDLSHYTNAVGCMSRSAGGYGFILTAGACAALCIADVPADDGFYLNGDAAGIVNCTTYGSVGGSGVRILADREAAFVVNCIFEGNNQFGIEHSGVYDPIFEDYNAFENNAAGDSTGIAHALGAHDILDATITGSVFTNAAGGDFSLNNTANRGALLRGAGFPGAMLDGTNVGYADIGAIQHTEDYPAITDVRTGIVYDDGALTGTCAVPAAADVESGVPVDAGVGTFTEPGIANVRTAITYGGGGVEFIGTCAVPALADVEAGVAVDAGVGTFTEPGIANVRLATTYGGGGVEFTGTAAIPAAGDVEAGVAVGAGVGTFAVPAVEDVEAAVGYGAAGVEFIGTLAVPAISNVRLATAYGAGGIEFVGALAVPPAGDVELGVAVDAGLGTFVVPIVGDVSLAVGYGAGGTEFTGTNPRTDSTGPGAPAGGTPSAGEDSVTFPVTLPTDADYHHITATLVPVLGGTPIEGDTASPTATVVTVPSLAAGTTYLYVLLAYDASGNASIVGGYSMGLVTTLPATTIARPAHLKWYINDEADYHEFGPEALDPVLGGDQRVPHLGRGRRISLVLECHEPVAVYRIRGIGLDATVGVARPRGAFRDEHGT